MLASRKRLFGVLGAIFAMITSIQLLFWDLVLVLDNLIKKLTGNSFLKDNFSDIVDFGIQKEYRSQIAPNYDYYSFMYSVMFLIGIFMLISALKYLRNPIVNGKVNYYTKMQLLATIIIAAMDVFLVLGLDDVVGLLSGDLFPLLCYEMIGMGALSVTFYTLSIFAKKNSYVVEEVIEKREKQSPDIDTIYTTEKVNRIKQMYKVGAISKAQYDDAIAKISRGA